jgi:hypothetical protein
VGQTPWSARVPLDPLLGRLRALGRRLPGEHRLKQNPYGDKQQNESDSRQNRVLVRGLFEFRCRRFFCVHFLLLTGEDEKHATGLPVFGQSSIALRIVRRSMLLHGEPGRHSSLARLPVFGVKAGHSLFISDTEIRLAGRRHSQKRLVRGGMNSPEADTFITDYSGWRGVAKRDRWHVAQNIDSI